MAGKNSKRVTAEELELIATHARHLIAAGVTSFSIGDVTVTLAPPRLLPLEVKPSESAPRIHADPLRDPATYPGGRLPGFTREGELP